MLPPISSEEENLFALLRTQTQHNTTLALALLKGQAIDPHIFLARWILENAHHHELYFAQTAALHIWGIPNRQDLAQKQILSEHLKKIGAYIRPELEKFILEGILNKGEYPSLYLAGKFLDNITSMQTLIEKNMPEIKAQTMRFLKSGNFINAVEFGEFLIRIYPAAKPILEQACEAVGIRASAQALTFAKAARMGLARRFIAIFV